MELRIGFTQSPHVIEIELPVDGDREALRSLVGAAVNDKTMLSLVDRKGGDWLIPGGHIGFVEIGADSGDRRIGFGA